MKTNADIVKDYEAQIKRFDVEIADLRKVYHEVRFDQYTKDESMIELGCHITALQEARNRAEKWRKAYANLPPQEADGFPCPF